MTPVSSSIREVGGFADLFNQLDAYDHVKGKQFEHICKWFLTNVPVYSRHHDRRQPRQT